MSTSFVWLAIVPAVVLAVISDAPPARAASGLAASPSVTAAADPIGVAAFAADDDVELSRAPGARPFARGEAQAFAQLRSVAASSSAPVLALVWQTQRPKGRAGPLWALAQWADRPAWIRVRTYQAIEAAMTRAPVLIGREWDRRAFASPVSEDALAYDDSPDVLRFVSYIPAFEASAPGAGIGLFAAPNGAPLDGPLEATAAASAFAGPPKPPPFVVPIANAGQAFVGAGADFPILVYDQSGSWLRVRLQDEAPYDGRWAWVEVAGGAPKAFAGDAERAAAIAANPILASARAARDAEPGFNARVLKAEVIAGRLWGMVEVYREDLCRTDAKPGHPGARGWIPLFASSGREPLVRVGRCD